MSLFKNFVPTTPMRFPLQDRTVSQAELYNIITSDTMDVCAVAAVVETIIVAAQEQFEEESMEISNLDTR